MGIFDEIKGKVEEFAAEHGDQIDNAIDKATDKLDELTGGKTASARRSIRRSMPLRTRCPAKAPPQRRRPTNLRRPSSPLRVHAHLARRRRRTAGAPGWRAKPPTRRPS